ncbi:A1 cistron-splicing factor [Gamsiella multidivaricata]|uniref:A1 cistron-splicing factor n=1 Tax=Gamsiella multidivaricata TaxID=101098 RepID=UPI00221F9624|nr:A1 cistron-splicing factor [Gamsiella multidivaricata]KAG0366968.1 a1-alpha2 repression [Gamsiella multidivaricata]KAI7830181.1 A1 cistron-splicing factor [Gamsiella multidivaricata]
MDNETLKKLFKAGAILLVLDAPQNQLEFGIDVNCWNTGPRFKGIKIIPPGAHFVYYSLHNTKSTQANPDDEAKADGTLEVIEGGTTGGDVRIGFWHQFESGEVVVMKWNAYNENMELEKDVDQIARYKAGIQEFDPFLGPYPLLPPEATYPAWIKLANHITQKTISRLFPEDGFVDSYDDQLEAELSRATKIIDREQKEEKEKAEKERLQQSAQQVRSTNTIQEEDETAMETDSTDDQHAAPSAKDISKRPKSAMEHISVKFTPIDLRSSFRKGAVGEEVTRYSLDKSWLLNNLFSTVYKSDVSAFLGEYQSAFVTMLLSYHLGAFRQWKTMTILVCQSTEATSSSNYTSLFSEFIQTLLHQLTSIPSSFFMDLLFASPDQDDMTANFLEQALRVMGRNIQSGLRRGQCLELRKPMHALQKAVQESFEWKIPGDFKKIQKVVEVTNEMGLASDEDDDYEEEGEYAPVIVQ